MKSNMNNNKMKKQNVPSKSVNIFDAFLTSENNPKSDVNDNNKKIKEYPKEEQIIKKNERITMSSKISHLPSVTQFVNKEEISKKIKKDESEKKIIIDAEIQKKKEDPKPNKEKDLVVRKEPNKKLHTPWDVYIHDFPSNNWSPTSYDYIFEIKTIIDFWKLFKQLDKINTYTSNLFIMRSGIDPVWESEDNRKGGECSICIDADRSNELFELLSTMIMGEYLVSNPTLINGISIVTKKITTHDNPDGKNSSYIKIWMRTKFREIRSIIDKNINYVFPQLSIIFKEYDKPDKKGMIKLKRDYGKYIR